MGKDLKDVIGFMRQGESLVVSRNETFSRPVTMEVRIDDYHHRIQIPTQEFHSGKWKNAVIEAISDVRSKLKESKHASKK